MDIILIAGLWLQRSAWDDVTGQLDGHGHRGVPVSLPGQDDRNRSATLADQVAAVAAAIDSCEGKPMVVGHSAACGLAWLAADARPDTVAKVVLVGGFPGADGDTYADIFPVQDGLMEFPGWEPFDGPDTADLDDATKNDMASRMVPVPQGVSHGLIELTDERRYDVPLVMVCPEYSPADVQESIEQGALPELVTAANVTYRDIDSGHWPMVSMPAEFARLLSREAEHS